MKHIFSENIASWEAGIAVRKNFCCTKKFEKIVNRLKTSGIIKKLYDTQLYKSRYFSSKLQREYEIESAISLHELSGTFLVLAFGYIVSTFALIFEKKNKQFNS